MSLFSRALAGAGKAASDIGSRYIDDSILQNRQAAFMALQETYARRADDYNLSPDRQARLNQIDADRLRATSAAQDQVALDRGNNPALRQLATQQATDAATNQVAASNITLPSDVARAGSIAQAQYGARPIETAPGGIVFDSKGNVIARNDNMTGPEAQLELGREGFKGQAREQRLRGTEAQLSILRDSIKTAEKQIAEGLDSGAMVKEMPADDKAFALNPFGKDKLGKDNPAYKAYQSALGQLNGLRDEAKNLAASLDAGGRDASSNGPPATRLPFGPIGKSGDSGKGVTPEPGDNQRQVSPATQASRDSESARLIADSEFSGNVTAAKDGLAKIDVEISKQQKAGANGDTLRILQTERGKIAAAIDVLERRRTETKPGIESPSNGPPAKTSTVAPPAGAGTTMPDKSATLAPGVGDPRPVATSIAGAAVAAGVEPPRPIPPPPPQYGFNGNARAENPAFTAWNRRYNMADYQAQEEAYARWQERANEAARQRVDAVRSGGAMQMRGNV